LGIVLTFGVFSFRPHIEQPKLNVEPDSLSEGDRFSRNSAGSGAVRGVRWVLIDSVGDITGFTPHAMLRLDVKTISVAELSRVSSAAGPPREEGVSSAKDIRSDANR